MTAMGALPRRFRSQRLLVVGCGDVGIRAVHALDGRMRVLALTSSPDRRSELRAMGIQPLVGNLDDAVTLRRLAGLGTRVLYLAPPPVVHGTGWAADRRMLAFTRALRLRTLPRSFVYASTSGVYGDCRGEWVAETRPLNPQTPRAARRVHAEDLVRELGRSSRVSCTVLRIPGIYAPDRKGGTPRERLMRGTPVLRQQDDVYTNHIHADDLARACVLALWRGTPQRCVNVSDDSEIAMGDYFDLAADLFGLPRPTRISRDEARAQLPLALLSFMGESRRLSNVRMKTELGLVLRYPTVAQGLVGAG